MKDEVLIRIESIKIELDGLNEVLNKKLDDIEVDLIRFYFSKNNQIFKFHIFSSISKNCSIDVNHYEKYFAVLKNSIQE